MPLFRNLSETLARKTNRRGFFGRGADVAFGALAGVAAGTLTRGTGVLAVGSGSTKCAFPGPPCACETCLSNGLCAKPCVILTQFYASGCWVTGATGNITCCDCDCSPGTGTELDGWCGCGSDYHNNPTFCP